MRRPIVLVVILGLVLAAAIAACASDGSSPRGARVGSLTGAGCGGRA